MKTKFFKHGTSVIFYVLILSIAGYAFANRNLDRECKLAELNKVLQNFATIYKNKDASGMRQIFVSDSSRLNFMLMNYGKPYLASLSREPWVNFFTDRDQEFYAVYSDVKFIERTGMAVDSHHFLDYNNGKLDVSGTDLFMYIETENGWKMMNVSSTIFNPDDSINYKSVKLIASAPEGALTAFENGFNSHDEVKFKNAFVTPTAACFRFQNKISEYHDIKNSAEAFYTHVAESVKNGTLTLTKTNIDVHDQVIAIASSDCTIKNDKGVTEQGEMLATLIATPDKGWKISAMAFSVKTVKK